MNPKPIIWIGTVIGSTLGSMVPLLWHADIFSVSSIIGSLIGGILGIWAGFRISQNM